MQNMTPSSTPSILSHKFPPPLPPFYLTLSICSMLSSPILFFSVPGLSVVPLPMSRHALTLSSMSCNSRLLTSPSHGRSGKISFSTDTCDLTSSTQLSNPATIIRMSLSFSRLTSTLSKRMLLTHEKPSPRTPSFPCALELFVMPSSSYIPTETKSSLLMRESSIVISVTSRTIRRWQSDSMRPSGRNIPKLPSAWTTCPPSVCSVFLKSLKHRTLGPAALREKMPLRHRILSPVVKRLHQLNLLYASTGISIAARIRANLGGGTAFVVSVASPIALMTTNPANSLSPPDLPSSVRDAPRRFHSSLTTSLPLPRFYRGYGWQDPSECPIAPSVTWTETAPPLPSPPLHLINNPEVQAALHACRDHIKVETPFNVDRFENLLFDHVRQLRHQRSPFWVLASR